MKLWKPLAASLLSTLLLWAALGNAASGDVPPPSEAPRKAADKKTRPGLRAEPSETTCAISVTWWQQPLLAEGQSLELGLQASKGVVRINPAVMSMGSTVLYEGPAAVTIVRKTLVPDPSGKPGAKPVEAWVPFTTFKINPNDQEVLALLFENDGQVRTRSFNVEVANFPFGGFHIYNYGKTRLTCNMGGKIFNAEPGTRTLSPLVMTKREVVNFFLGIPDPDGKLQIIYRAPLILTHKIRRIYVVLENAEAESENRFVTNTLLQHVAGHHTIETLRQQAESPSSSEAPPVDNGAATPKATTGEKTQRKPSPTPGA